MSNSVEILLGDSLVACNVYGNDGDQLVVHQVQRHGLFQYKIEVSNTSKRSIFLNVPIIPEFEIGMYWYNYGPVFAWMVPQVIRHGQFCTHDKVRFIYWRLSNGAYAAFSPLSNHQYSTEFSLVNDRLEILVHFDTDITIQEPVAIFSLTYGFDPYRTIKEATLSSKRYPAELDEGVPDFFKTFGWCSWNAFGHEVSHVKLIEAGKDFFDKKIKIGWFLIDDGWMDVSGKYGQGKLKSFAPERNRFPLGLVQTVAELKENFGIEKVGIWLTIGGYWKGIEKESDLFEKYKDELVAIPYKLPWSDDSVEEIWIPIVKGNERSIFFRDWFAFLKSQGIDFVKIDHLNFLTEIARYLPNGNLVARNILLDLDLAIREVFGEGHVIYCMGMVPEVFLNLSNQRICRITEDYFPNNFSYNPLAGNAAVHAVNNFSLSTWMQYLVKPDADMFQSHHPQGNYHAAIRFMMGGVKYVTDALGLQDQNVYKIDVGEEGELRRWGTSAVPIPSCLFQLYESKPYIVFANGYDGYFIGIFNVADADVVEGDFILNEIPDLEGDAFEVQSLKNGETFKKGRFDPISIKLGRMDWEIFFYKIDVIFS